MSRRINELFAFIVLIWLPFINCQVQLLNVSATQNGLTSTCIAVLNQAVSCDPSISWAGNGRYEDLDTLTALCTTTCTSALATWERRVVGACGTTRYITPGGWAVLPVYLVEVYVESYETVCLKNSAGQFCNSVVGSLVGVNPANQQPTANASTGLSCNPCVLSGIQTQLEMPLASTAFISTAFSSLTKSCSVTNYTVTTPSPTLFSTWANSSGVTVPPASPTPSCVGTTYTIKSGDTCNSISISQGISTTGLLGANSLLPLCTNFPVTGTLCIPTAEKCTVYTVQTGDTCASIGTKHSSSWAQMVSWNPALGRGCANIADYVGYEICVSNPGGSWVNPSPNLTTTATTTIETVFTLSWTPMDAFPTPTGAFNSTYNISTVIPFANGTRTDCNLYAQVNVTTTNNTCSAVAEGYSVELSDFLAWNPSLASASPCLLQNNLQYCAQVRPLQMANITSYCSEYDVALPGEDCDDFMAHNSIEIDWFSTWNPPVGTLCQNWLPAYNYCVAVEHYKQPGIVSTCNKFAMANETAWLMNPCTILETEFGLSHARFVAWNPALLSNCTGIVQGYDYCVSIPNYKPTYSTTSMIPAPNTNYISITTHPTSYWTTERPLSTATP